MIRYTAAVVLAIVLHPALARGQETVLTVDVPSADVYKSATTAAPVIGHAPRGTVLPVARNLGSWVKVTWPDGPEVSIRLGTLDDDPGIRPQTHSFASDAPAWAPVPDDGLPRYDGPPPSTSAASESAT